MEYALKIGERQTIHSDRGWKLCQSESKSEAFTELGFKSITTFFFVVTPYNNDTIHGVAVKLDAGDWSLNYRGIERLVRNPDMPASFIPIIESFVILGEL